MATAIFGISNDGLNLVVNLLVLMLVVVWLALIVYTYLDAKRRISDSFLVGCATLASFIPYIGTAVYAIVRPPEFLEDAHERELEIKAAELRVRQLEELTCGGCGYPIEKSYLRCPQCQRRLKDPCSSCGKPVDSRWALCPHCETPLGERDRPRRRNTSARRKASTAEHKEVAAERSGPAAANGPAAATGEPPETSKPKRPQRSPSREPDPDPRQA
jgi:double zinc ribbon protein